MADDQWFEEKLEINAGVRTKVKITKHILSKRSEFQQIDVYETEMFGKMLVLDGIIQLTQSDEACYHEMIAHVPLSVHAKHADAGKVLIIGGGDGGGAREVLKHSVREVHVCDLDPEVIAVCKEQFPEIACSYDDERVSLFHEDGHAFLKSRKNMYDVIIVDSTDPIGPGKSLFTRDFYASCCDALTDDGILITQAESFFYHTKIIKEVMSDLKSLFPIVSYYHTKVPTYPSGMIGFTFASKKHTPLELKPVGISGLQYYSEDVHRAAFVLPPFVTDFLQ